MSKISFNYESSTLGTDSFSNDLDYEVATNKGNYYGLNPSTHKVTIASIVNTLNTVTVSVLSDTTDFSATQYLGAAADIKFIFGVMLNGEFFGVANERDSLILNYNIASNKINGSFSGRLTNQTATDSLTITNGVFDDVPLVQ